ncbi:MAG: pyruvate, phosphate dikinase, partial [Candidatus Eisenbacteria bacterium]|nr:pyruvate, phosphate dikinase [Candidatus Latescibacterota bacterium]MBD3302952.1 pyruvate, phosphate dikinase [Candidatus Eisenbacteria bacterium]
HKHRRPPMEYKDLLGGKGANLAEMTSVLELPVPPGFTISLDLCRRYLEERRLPAGFREALREGVGFLEQAAGARFGDARRPLLVSARSGAAVSMPGMLDTVLNLGLNEESVQGLMRKSGNPRFAWDSFRRLVAMFGEVVCAVPRLEFERLLEEAKQEAGVEVDYELDARTLRGLTRGSLSLFERRTGRPFPMDPYDQLSEAIIAVFDSWNSERAQEYRRIHEIEGLEGTAVTVQSMVFGNSGADSGTGVAFTRDPVTGKNVLYLDFLFNAQGEDIVAGIRTPQAGEDLVRELPEVSSQLEEIRLRLEQVFTEMQDIEFTVEEGKLFLLQTRTGKRSPLAALRIAIDQVEEGMISKGEALDRLAGFDPAVLRTVRIEGDPGVDPIGTAIPACSGVAAGRIALSSARAREFSGAGSPIILVREDTSADDISGMAVSAGILTARGGRTSHAAVVARQMGIPCLVGCRDLRIDLPTRTAELRGSGLREGEPVTLDANSGRVYPGDRVPLSTSEPEELGVIREWIRQEGASDHPLAR